MPAFEVAFFADKVGTMFIPSSAGSELPNGVGRRWIATYEFGYSRVQFATDGALACNIRIEYSNDNGATWFTMIPDTAAGLIADVNVKSDWILMPPDSISDVLIRAVVTGDDVTPVTIRYLSVGIR